MEESSKEEQWEESSEQRKQRFKSMKLSQSSSFSSSISQNQSNNSLLSNPFLEYPSLITPTPTPPPQRPRFDFYTDPTSAFSTHTPRPRPSSFQGPRNPEMRPAGAPQFHHNYASHQGMYQGGHSPGMPGPSPSPMGIRSPFPMHQGDPNVSPAPWGGLGFNNYPSPTPGSGGSPNFRSPQVSGHWSNNSPNPNLGRGGYPSPGPGCGGYPSPGPGRGGYPSPGPGRGRGQWHDSSMSPNPGYSGGRGRGGGRMSPNSGYSGGRGRGGGYHDSQGRSFYNRSMVEDPWESLTPVLWQGQEDDDIINFANRQGPFKGTPPFHKASFQKTPIAKKPRVSNPFDASNSKQSLAEFLSESFDEGH